jgi:CRISPR-associated protein Csb2
VHHQQESTQLPGYLAALCWLETQTPTIIAPEISSEIESSSRFLAAIPQNNPAKTNLQKNSVILPRYQRVRGVASGPLKVEYIWGIAESDLDAVSALHLSALADLTAQIRYLGRAEDQVEAAIELVDTPPIGNPAAERQTWRPSDRSTDVQLLATRAGTTQALISNFNSIMPARTRKPPATRFLLLRSYAKDAVESTIPLQAAIFQLGAETANPDDPPLSCDPESCGIWRSRIRQRAVEFALESERWDNPSLALELITGHPPGEAKPTTLPHLAFVPLPSVSPNEKADGRVRRVALLGYAPAENAEEAADIYRILFAALEHESIALNENSSARLERLGNRPGADRVWSQFNRASKIWLSVTPVAISRGFDVPTHSQDGSRKLTSNERHTRKLQEWNRLLRLSLQHIGLPQEVANHSTMLLTPSPLIPNTVRAERYRPPGETAAFTHARIEFDEAVRGPLLIGDRRYKGFGLLLPST